MGKHERVDEESVIHSIRQDVLQPSPPSPSTERRRPNFVLSRKECGDGGERPNHAAAAAAATVLQEMQVSAVGSRITFIYIHPLPRPLLPPGVVCGWAGRQHTAWAWMTLLTHCSPITNKQPSILLGLRRDEKRGGEACTRSQPFIHSCHHTRHGMCVAAHRPQTFGHSLVTRDDSSHCIRLWSVWCSPNKHDSSISHHRQVRRSPPTTTFGHSLAMTLAAQPQTTSVFSGCREGGWGSM